MTTLNQHRPGDEELERAIVERVIKEGFQSVWHLPAAVAIAWWRERYGQHLSEDDITRDLVFNTLTEYVGEFGSPVEALKHAAVEAYPKPNTEQAKRAGELGIKSIDLDAFPFKFIDWDKAAKDYLAYGVKVVNGRHYFDSTGAAWKLTQIF